MASLLFLVVIGTFSMLDELKKIPYRIREPIPGKSVREILDDQI
jgi:hypothetical protein